MKLTVPVEKGYCRNLIFSGVLQLFLLLLGALAMDGGQLGMWVVYGVGTYWVMAVMIIARRPKLPTKGDLMAIKYGFILILICVYTLTRMRWARDGILQW